MREADERRRKSRKLKAKSGKRKAESGKPRTKNQEPPPQKNMTLRRLLDLLQKQAAELGPDREVRAWMLAEPQPLGQFAITAVRSGWDARRQEPVATLYLTEHTAESRKRKAES